MKRIKIYFAAVALAWLALSCSTESLNLDGSAIKQSAIDIAQTSGQLASGTSFSITGSSTDTIQADAAGGHGHKHHGKHKGILDGLYLLAPTDELLAIVDAESAGDIRGLRMSKNGGATVTHYNAAGEVVTLNITDTKGPQGCSFSGHQFVESDSILATLVKTVVDFGSGVTFKRDTVEITRAGKIVIERSITGSTIKETSVFENYTVNGILIEGTKTRVSTYDETTGSGSSQTTVTNGRITFTDGTIATWTSDKLRVSEFVLSESTGKPISGTITTTVSTEVVAGGETIYSHQTSAPLIEDIACQGRKRSPVSGILKTVYRDDAVEVNFGDGTCTNNTITITFNGVTITKTVG